MSQDIIVKTEDQKRTEKIDLMKKCIECDLIRKVSKRHG